MRELSGSRTRAPGGAGAHWQLEEGGYAHIQGTKPQTLAYGLRTIPRWGWRPRIRSERWRTWSDCNGEVERRLTKDELLPLSLSYWVIQTINSSTRLYFENQHNPWIIQPGQVP